LLTKDNKKPSIFQFYFFPLPYLAKTIGNAAKKDSLSERLRVGSFQGSLDILNGNNVFFSRIEVSYDCRVGLLLLPISSLSPHDARSNGFKLKGKKPVLPSNAERSRLGRVASPYV
jgi:hypothetical protein